ncbi:MAG: zinc-binding alcohol dehydrogenase family protein [Pseudonocardia sp.]
MYASRVLEFGPPSALRWSAAPDPVAGPGAVVVEVVAAGVNRADALFRAGRYHRGPQLPATPGLEAAGRIVAVGAGVTDLQVGRRVVAWGAIGDPGFYAERAEVPAERVLPVPDEVELIGAAAVPVAWLTAWYSLHRLGGVRPGDVVLVHAGASGVGSAAVQIAKDAGARVIATAGGEEKVKWVHDLGADVVLDHTAADVPAEVLAHSDGRGANVVLDLVGGETFAGSLRAAARAANVVALANVALAPSVIDTRDFYPKNVHIHGFQVTDLMEHGYDPRPDLAEVLAGLAQRRFAVPVDSTFPLADAASAHARLESRAVLGKVLLTGPTG